MGDARRLLELAARLVEVFSVGHPGILRADVGIAPYEERDVSSQTQLRLTREEFLAAERRAESKNEYRNGDVVAMSGASFSHNLIVANLVGELRFQLKKRPCSVLPSDMRVLIEAAERYVYPDVTVVCGEPELTDDEQDTIVNPKLIVEVLSKTTRDYDHGDKFLFYRTLPSFQEYVLVSQKRPFVEHYLKQSDGKWLLAEVHGMEASVTLESISCRLELAEIYDKVDVPQVSLRPVDGSELLI